MSQPQNKPPGGKLFKQGSLKDTWVCRNVAIGPPNLAQRFSFLVSLHGSNKFPPHPQFGQLFKTPVAIAKGLLHVPGDL